MKNSQKKIVQGGPWTLDARKKLGEVTSIGPGPYKFAFRTPRKTTVTSRNLPFLAQIFKCWSVFPRAKVIIARREARAPPVQV